MVVILAQLNFTVGDLQGNSDKIIKTAIAHQGTGKDRVIVFSEMAISGYPPLDLVDNPEFIKAQGQSLQHILEETKHVECPLFIGYIEPNNGPGRNLFNSVAVCVKGQIVYNYRKRLLPTYDVFDEARYFEPGKDIGLWQYCGKRIGILLCEDLWYKNKSYTLNTAEELYRAHADMIIVPNASPSVVGKDAFRKNMVSDISKKYALPIYYVNQVGGNDEIVFDGNSFYTDKDGTIISTARAFDEHILGEPILTTLVLQPFENDASFFYQQAVYGLREYARKCGFKTAVVGSSGGIDSAVVLALAAEALGPDNVTAITMPSQYSSAGSLGDSFILCNNLGVQCHTVPIKDAFTGILSQFNGAFEPADSGVMEENMQARIRGMLLMSYSNRYGALLLTTGNKSELAVGFCTIYGDMCGGYNPIGGLYKTEVYDVARYINRTKEIIPSAIIDKVPSAELSPGQRDDQSLPPYDVLDPILKLVIEGDLLPKEDYLHYVRIAKANTEHVKKTLALISKAEYKRRQGALCIKMHAKDFGIGRRMPIAQKWPLSLSV